MFSMRFLAFLFFTWQKSISSVFVRCFRDSWTSGHIIVKLADGPDGKAAVGSCEPGKEQVPSSVTLRLIWISGPKLSLSGGFKHF